ncbi:SRPBCC family protein [Olivibacter sp. SDN3]|uniref:SRPBCC family protein n=1 Tax=Olivibacter sp. SDN3 TaxID=2764720 RepID=UPI001650F404|nr:SRPBCC family protein [Olivibacter sp. SDN3]QNL51693.1 SRPBCC family protein [Olivibacter sp. SDN3]
MKYRLYREQQLHCDLQTAWSFFSSATNLSKITPEEMRFKVLSSFENDKIYEGMLIDYYVTPFLGIPLKWQTEIVQVDFQKSFTDSQKKGPYKLWHHFHEFVPNENGILMKDTVDYELPFGILGDWVHRLLVKRKLQAIFDFRRKVLEKKF